MNDSKKEAALHGGDPDRYLKKAKRTVLHAKPIVAADPGLHESDLYVVWFSKTLANWKALVSTNRMDGMYYEVTHNGHSRETYVDVYRRVRNVTVTDDALSVNTFN